MHFSARSHASRFYLIKRHFFKILPRQKTFNTNVEFITRKQDFYRVLQDFTSTNEIYHKNRVNNLKSHSLRFYLVKRHFSEILSRFLSRLTRFFLDSEICSFILIKYLEYRNKVSIFEILIADSEKKNLEHRDIILDFATKSQNQDL
eukprot:g4432.t1